MKQFCLRGHDTLIVGRVSRTCRECKRQRAREWKYDPDRMQQFCLRGHDTSIVGRSYGTCKECKRQKKPAVQRRYRSTPRGRLRKRAAQRREYCRNGDKIRERMRRHYAAHREQCLARAKAWRKKNGRPSDFWVREAANSF